MSISFVFKKGYIGRLIAFLQKVSAFGYVSDGSNGQVLTTDGAGNLSFATASGGASDLDGLSDAKAGGTNFSNSLILGHATTGTLSNAQKNTFVGFGAGDEITSTQNSCGFGFNCLTNLESGARSNGYGKGALDSVTTGDDNTGLGFEAGQNISTGGENVAVGIQCALVMHTIQSFNSFAAPCRSR